MGGAFRQAKPVSLRRFAASRQELSLCGSNENSVYMSGAFQDNGFFVLPVRYPTVPKNEARIRFSLNAAIPEEDYECLLEFIEVSL